MNPSTSKNALRKQLEQSHISKRAHFKLSMSKMLQQNFLHAWKIHTCKQASVTCQIRVAYTHFAEFQ